MRLFFGFDEKNFDDCTLEHFAENSINVFLICFFFIGMFNDGHCFYCRCHVPEDVIENRGPNQGHRDIDWRNEEGLKQKTAQENL